jgi:threonine/homoserine/homoserine lactone efflux protein
MRNMRLMLTFAAAVFFLIITPGPGVLSAAGVGAGYGYGAGTRYVGGLFVGTNLVALAVVTGLAAILLADPRIRTVLFYASIAYLFYIALRIAFAGAKVAFIERQKAPGFLGGLALQAINPKAYAVNTALFTGFAFWPSSTAVEIALKFVIMNIIWIPIHFGWLWAGVSMRRLDLPPHVQRGINILMALSMLLVVALAAWAAS